MLRVLLTLVFFLSCSTTPTGRSQLKLIPDSKLVKIGSLSFAQLKSKGKLSQSTILKGVTATGAIALTGNSKKDLYLMRGMGLAHMEL